MIIHIAVLECPTSPKTWFTRTIQVTQAEDIMGWQRSPQFIEVIQEPDDSPELINMTRKILAVTEYKPMVKAVEWLMENID